MKLLLIVVQNTEEVAKLLPFLECQTLWRSFLWHNVPVRRMWDGGHLKCLKHYPQTKQFYIRNFFSFPLLPLLPSPLSWIISGQWLFLLVSPGSNRDWPYPKLSAGQGEPATQSMLQGMWLCGAEAETQRAKQRSTGIRQDWESSAPVTTEHATTNCRTKCLTASPLYPGLWYPGHTLKVLATSQAGHRRVLARKSLTHLEVVWWPEELEYQIPNLH